MKKLLTYMNKLNENFTYKAIKIKKKQTKKHLINLEKKQNKNQ